METQRTGQRAPGPQSAEPTVVTTKRVIRLWQSGGQLSSSPSPDVGWQHRLDTLEARTEYLETALEGLQDAVRHRAILEDENIGQLRKRTEPNQMARDLNRNARTRGL